MTLDSAIRALGSTWVNAIGPTVRTTVLDTLETVEVGLYAGSFDPIHLGHIALIENASAMLDRLVVVVAANTQKRTPMFRVPERFEMVSRACSHLSNVEVVTHSGLLIDIAAQVGASLLVRNAGKEHVDEEQMAYLNGCEGLRTILIPPDPKTSFISSSHVRSLIASGAVDAAASLIPATSKSALQN